MRGTQSTQVIIHEHIDVKQWIAALPSVDEARPMRCPCCGEAARPIGGRLVLHGHGLRERQLLGPLGDTATPVMVVALCRRYECQRCGTVVIVAPRGTVQRRHYSSLAIGLALAIFGGGATAATARREVSPFRGGSPTAGWVSLRRWLRAARRGALFATMPELAGSTREIAAAVGRFVMAHAPPTLREAPARVQVLAGALAMA